MCDGLEILGFVVTEMDRNIGHQWIRLGDRFLERTWIIGLIIVSL